MLIILLINVKIIRWDLIVNLDIFELSKTHVVPLGEKSGLRAAYIASRALAFPIWAQSIIWGALLIILLGVFSALYRYRNRIATFFKLPTSLSILKWCGIIVVQIVALPIGATVGKYLRCSPIVPNKSWSETQTLSQEEAVKIGFSNWRMDVENNEKCFTSGVHWMYLLIGLLLVLLVFIVPAIYFIVHIRRVLPSLTQQKHEIFLKLKEMEFERGLHLGWINQNFHLFSSFRSSCPQYRSINHCLKLIAIILYGAAFTNVVVQSALFSLFFFVQAVSFAFVRPYRLWGCTFLVVMSHFVHCVTCLLGCLRSSQESTEILSTFLSPIYLSCVLAGLQILWIVCLVAVLIFIAAQSRKINFRSKCVCCEVWPRFSQTDIDALEGIFGQYVRAVLEARATCEYCSSVSPFLAPVHELARQMLYVNALFRECELSGDPMKDALWDVLDETTCLYNHLRKYSIFSDSVKNSSQRTAAELLSIESVFAERLCQREFYLVFASSTMRRCLCKLYAIAIFYDLLTKIRHKQTLRKEELRKIWYNKYHSVEEGAAYRPIRSNYCDLLYPGDTTKSLPSSVGKKIQSEATIQFGKPYQNLDIRPLPQKCFDLIRFSDGDDSGSIKM